MNKLFALFAAGLLSIGTTQAATLDFSTTDFASTFPPIGEPPSVASVEVDGVNFTVTSIWSRGVNGFRQSWDNAGLNFGVPGNGMYAMTIIADTDILITDLTGEDRSNLNFTSPQLFDLSVNSSGQVIGFNFPSPGGIVDFADFNLSAGDVLEIAVDFTPRSGYSSIYAQGVLSAMGFDAPQTASVPLPAGLPLALGGLALLGWITRRKR